MKKLLILIMTLTFAGTASAKTHYGDWYVTGDISVGTIAEYLVNGSAMFDDSATDTSHGWTASKIQAVIDAAGGSDLEVEDESVGLDTAVTKLNFLGSGVTAVENADHEIDITIPGGTLPSGTLGDILQHDGGDYVSQDQIDGLINDPAGDGDVNSLWSADKIFDELALKANKVDVLELENTSAFTPDQDYEPATKKYVDDSGGAGGYVATPPTYSDESCTSGQYAWDTSTHYDYRCESTDTWDYRDSNGLWVDWDSPTPVLYTLTVTDPGNNNAITCADGDLSASINCGNGNTDCGPVTAVSSSEITGMTAVAAGGYEFTIWTGDITSTENPTTTPLTMDGNKSVGATFSVSTADCANLGTWAVYYDFDHTDGTTTACVQAGTITTSLTSATVASDDIGGNTTNKVNLGSLNDNYVTIVNNAYMSLDEGYIKLDLYHTVDESGTFWEYYAASTDLVYSQLRVGETERNWWYEGGTGSARNASSQPTINTWNTIEVRWDKATTSIDVRINEGVWSESDIPTGTAGTEPTNIILGEQSSNINGTTMTVYMDNVYISNSFSGGN